MFKFDVIYDAKSMLVMKIPVTCYLFHQAKLFPSLFLFHTTYAGQKSEILTLQTSKTKRQWEVVVILLNTHVFLYFCV